MSPKRSPKCSPTSSWVPGVNYLGCYGRWAFSEFTEIYRIESDFEQKVEAEFNKMVDVFGQD